MSDPRHVSAQLGLSLSRQLQTVIERQRNTSQHLADQAAKNGEATGFIELPAGGELVTEVVFPISFYEKPVFSFGFELGPSSYLVQGDFPVGTAVVASWLTADLNGTLTYTGARLGIVLVGLTGTGVCHFVFKGQSFTNPLGAM